MVQHPTLWARVVSYNYLCAPNKTDVNCALKAVLSLPPDKIDRLVDAAWQKWAPGENHLSGDALKNFVGAFEHLPIPQVLDKVDDVPESEHCCPAGFQCSCKKIHVHRGDRVARGPAWKHGDEDGGIDSVGTVVYDDESCGKICVQWDCRQQGDLSQYSWPPDVEQHEIMHVPFLCVPPNVKLLQEATGLSSLAAAELFRRVGPVAPQVAAGIFHNSNMSEDTLRMPLRLYQRCRILPDEELVHQLFEKCLPCPCNRPTCVGGVEWTQSATRHLGREGYMMEIDHRDETVLVELTGRCNCKIWYPKRAVSAVFDMDTIDEPRFAVGDVVECKMDGSWHRGTVNTVWWRKLGWGSHPTVPYFVHLQDGSHVFAPRDHDDVIRCAMTHL